MFHQSEDCVFCRILCGELPASFVYRDESVAAFMDINPINPGHLLIVPLHHSKSLTGVPPLSAGRLFQVAQSLLGAFERQSEVRYQGANVFLSEGEVAGQEVFHAHLHIAPRFRGDGHRMGFAGVDPDAGSRANLDRVALALRAALPITGPMVSTADLTVERARSADLEDWARMREELWPGAGVAAHLHDAEAMLHRPDVAVFIARAADDGGKARGFCEISIRPYVNGCDTAPVAFLEGIFIEASFRRTGIGRKLIEAAAKWAATKGFRELGSDSEIENHESIAAHEAWGFECTEQVQYLRFTIPGSFSGQAAPRKV